MAELTMDIDHLGHKELKEYLLSLDGILDVKIKNFECLEIYLKYNSDLITPRMIKTEILLFLDNSCNINYWNFFSFFMEYDTIK